MQKELNKDYFLWESFKNGDDQAFYNLYDQHVDSLLGFGLQFSRNTHLLKDCIHDLFLDLYKYRKQLSEIDNVKFYLFRSLRRKIQNELSKRSLLNFEIDGETSENLIQEPYDDVIIEKEIELENYEILKDAISKLTDQQKEALFLKFEQNLGYLEIATLQNITVESARTNIYRAIKALRKSIQQGKDFFQLLFLLLRK